MMQVEHCHLSEFTSEDDACVRQQLGRPVRGVVAVAHRCVCGNPQVIATSPRLPDGSPFPTAFYLTDPYLVRMLSGLEATQKMAHYQQILHEDNVLSTRYQQAHELYIRQRRQLADIVDSGDVPEIENVSAGGMPVRVKCLHALVGHALACGKGANPIGDWALRDLGNQWNARTCYCKEPSQDTVS